MKCNFERFADEFKNSDESLDGTGCPDDILDILCTIGEMDIRDSDDNGVNHRNLKLVDFFLVNIPC